MASSKKRYCVACGKEYYYCPNCEEDAGKPKWMYAFCSEACKTTYQTVTDVYAERKSKAEAYEILKDLIKEEDFKDGTDNMKKGLKEIFGTTEEVAVDEEPKADTVISDYDLEEITEDTVVPEETSLFTSKKRKRR